jgi:hypothetical protein
MFISLIVHKTADYSAKVVYELKMTTKTPVNYTKEISVKDTQTGEVVTAEETVNKIDTKDTSEMIVHNCIIQKAESSIEPKKWFIDKYDELIEENKKKVYSHSIPSFPVRQPYMGYNAPIQQRIDFFTKPEKINEKPKGKDYTLFELRNKIVDIIAESCVIEKDKREYMILERCQNMINFRNETEFFKDFVKGFRKIHVSIANARNIQIVNHNAIEDTTDDFDGLVEEINFTIESEIIPYLLDDNLHSELKTIVLASLYYLEQTFSAVLDDLEITNSYADCVKDMYEDITEESNEDNKQMIIKPSNVTNVWEEMSWE